MFVIKDDIDRYFAGSVCGCNVWKSHYTRAQIFNTVEDAMYEIDMLGIEDIFDVSVVKYSEEEL